MPEHPSPTAPASLSVPAAPSSTAISLLALMKLQGIGRRTALDIVDSPMPETCPETCREILLSRLPSRDGRQRSAADILAAWSRSEEEIARSQEIDVHAIALHDPAYPSRLRNTPDPPAVLFAKGTLLALDPAKALAIVGTREPTPFGDEVAHRSGRTAARTGYVIVSGLALGCDTQVHAGCLDADGTGVAVLAHGLETVYPAANRDLADKLLDAGGCLASEYPIGTRPTRSAFPDRDRIQSGLSDAVLVIETDVKGGTMHTVRFARQQHRPLACIDHPPGLRSQPKTKGNRKLLDEDSATPIPDGAALDAFLQRLASHPGAPAPTAAEPVPDAPDAEDPQHSFSF